jgi:hypothetical protein
VARACSPADVAGARLPVLSLLYWPPDGFDISSSIRFMMSAFAAAARNVYHRG